MKQRIFALIMVCVMLVGVLAACGSKGPVSQEKAQKIALEYAGLKASDVSDAHIHVTEKDGIPCYSIHITTADKEFSILVNATTGEVVE